METTGQMQSRMLAISPTQQDFGKVICAPEQKQHPSIFIDGSNEAAWGYTPKAVNTDWSRS